MNKPHKVVMLPTNQKATNGLQPVSNYSKPVTRGGVSVPISLDQLNRLLRLGCQAYHLYVLSEDEIQEGDYIFYMDDSKELVQCTTGRIHAANQEEWIQKVIASTDTSLGLPTISEEDLKRWCETQPSEVLVKYEAVPNEWDNPFSNPEGIETPDSEWELYASDNNQISIKQVQQTYNRDEVIEIIRQVQEDAEISSGSQYYRDPESFL